MKKTPIDQIRNRKSYREFEAFLAFLQTNPSHKAILYQLFKVVDGHYGYHTLSNRDYALQSLDTLVLEKRLE